MEKINHNDFNDIYNQISELLGINAAIKIHQVYNGMQITFPKKLFNQEYLHQKIISEYDGTNIKLLAKKYDYSEKSIRRIVREI